MDLKIRPIYMLPIRISLLIQRHSQTKSEVIEKIFHVNGNKKAEVVIHTLDSLGFRTKVTIRNKDGYYMIIRDQSKKIQPM